MRIKGWARLYEEPNEKEGGIFSFTHSLFIYPLKNMADDEERDRHSKCLGIFYVEWDIVDGKIVFYETNGAPGMLAGLEKENG